MLRASVGSFDMFPQSTTIFENLKDIITEKGQRVV